MILVTLFAHNILTDLYFKHVIYDQEKLSEIQRVALDYYENLFDLNFQKALKLVDYEGKDRGIDIKWLEENTDYYLERLEGPMLSHVRYDEKRKQYTLFSFIEVNNNGAIQYLNEHLYFKKVNGKYLIDLIISDDTNVIYRSNRWEYPQYN